MKHKNKIISITIAVAVLFTIMLCTTFSSSEFASAAAPGGICNNGLAGINIDVNSSPYTDFAEIPTWGQYAYGPSGCAWFASARVRQLTGKGNMIHSGSTWYNSAYSNFGFSRGSELRAPALVCWSNHVAVLEKIDGNTAYISEGGMSGYGSNASTGYTIIRAVSASGLTSLNAGFIGFVYFNANTTPAISLQSIPDGIYRMETAVDSGKCLDVSSGSSESGANVWLYRNNASNAQKFRFVRHSSGYYKIVNIGSGMCLDVYGGETTPGANVWQYEDNGSDAQLWGIVDAGNGYSYVVSKRNGLYLDVAGGLSDDGTNVRVWTGNETPAQKWKIHRTSDTAFNNTAYYKIETAVGTDKCISVKHEDSNVIINTNNSSYSQIFKLEMDMTGCYKIVNVENGMCLDVYGGGASKGTNVWQYKDNGSDAQRWCLVNAGAGYYYIISKLNGLCLDVAGGLSDNGTNVRVWSFNDTPAQKWRPAPISYKISYNTNGGAGTIASQNKDYNVPVNISNVTPVREGYTFIGWAAKSDAKSADYIAGDSYKLNKDIVLYAVWKQNAKPTAVPTKSPTIIPSETITGVQTVIPTNEPDLVQTEQTSDVSSQTILNANDLSEEMSDAYEQSSEVLDVGYECTVNGIRYAVTSVDNGKYNLLCIGALNDEITTAIIPATVTIDGTAYKVTEIGNYAFNGCIKLKSVTIGKYVTKIGKNAFCNCKKLKKIMIKSIVIKNIGKCALSGIYEKTVIKVPKKQYAAYKKMIKKAGIYPKVKIKK